ncbi:hypothetical protein YC2023_043247 [Brassica napus]
MEATTSQRQSQTFIGGADATPESKTGREHRNRYTKTTDSLSHKSTLNLLKDEIWIREKILSLRRETRHNYTVINRK